MQSSLDSAMENQLVAYLVCVRQNFAASQFLLQARTVDM